MKVTSFIYRMIAVSGLVFALGACSDEGPMEKAGKQLDETAQDTQNAIEDKCENLKESLNAEDKDC
ncbi:hypothetical protein RND59_00220 [Vibrio ruber]|uniref:Major outer membrane lipoprotein Lpp n=1 Tax=Vibrio ruber (strain DSM 16370 / JCM 11486 / BCRC 17186 / CECT 7878 / LMG 23124 / VR1) TaxID=1123498 RepID=A0A1R4LSC3_VIBR1|nr:hypothetical protein [Vibrio ruber]WNJ95582.1 hypothetical protein RND59_00220 [Vibrio ruber]SJN59217.1 hypothetical protein VR7878_03294 [Vibrio ruber DSM 16370]